MRILRPLGAAPSQGVNIATPNLPRADEPGGPGGGGFSTPSFAQRIATNSIPMQQEFVVQQPTGGQSPPIVVPPVPTPPADVPVVQPPVPQADPEITPSQGVPYPMPSAGGYASGLLNKIPAKWLKIGALTAGALLLLLIALAVRRRRSRSSAV